MQTKSIALTIVFAAIAIALNPAFSRIAIPAPFFPFISYQIWEIPIVTAFMIIGPKHGVLAAIINGAILFAFFPGVVSLGDVLACLSMLLGIFVVTNVITRNNPAQETRYTARSIASYTVLGVIFRISIMAVLDYVFLLRPIAGVSVDEAAVLAMIPLIAIFNLTQPLYTVPIGCFIAKTVGKSLK